MPEQEENFIEKIANEQKEEQENFVIPNDIVKDGVDLIATVQVAT